MSEEIISSLNGIILYSPSPKGNLSSICVCLPDCQANLENTLSPLLQAPNKSVDSQASLDSINEEQPTVFPSPLIRRHLSL